MKSVLSRVFTTVPKGYEELFESQRRQNYLRSMFNDLSLQEIQWVIEWYRTNPTWEELEAVKNYLILLRRGVWKEELLPEACSFLSRGERKKRNRVL